MAEFNIPPHGTICWRELGTNDPAAAANFYRALLGWKLERSKTATVNYTEIFSNGNAVGGIIPACQGEGGSVLPSRWLTYIAVDDADQTIAKIKATSGNIRADPFDVPQIGRIAIAEDPAGAPFAIIQFVQPAS